MASELELLRQRISELETKNTKLEAEKIEIEARNAELLKQVMEKDAKRDAQGCVGLGTRSMPRYSYRIRARSHKLLKDNHELLPLAIPHLVYVDCILNSNCL